MLFEDDHIQFLSPEHPRLPRTITVTSKHLELLVPFAGLHFTHLLGTELPVQTRQPRPVQQMQRPVR